MKSLNPITSIHKMKSIHKFCNKLATTVQTLTTMNKGDSAKSFVSTLMDKWGPEQQIIAQKKDDWENQNLEELVEIIKK